MRSFSSLGLAWFNNFKSDKRGFTLIELLIGIAVGSFILLVVAQLVTTGLIHNLFGFSSFNSQSDAIATLNRVSKEIRQGPGIIIANTQNVTILEYLNVTDTAPHQVRFFLSGTDFRRGVIPPTGSPPTYTYNPASETFKTLATSVNNGVSAIFDYYDQDGNLLSSPIVVGNITLVKMTLKFGETNTRSAFTATTQSQLRFKKTNL